MHIYLWLFVFSSGAACRNLSMFLQKPKMSRCEAKISPFEGSGRIWPGNDIASMHNLSTCAMGQGILLPGNQWGRAYYCQVAEEAEHNTAR